MKKFFFMYRANTASLKIQVTARNLWAAKLRVAREIHGLGLSQHKLRALARNIEVIKE